MATPLRGTDRHWYDGLPAVTAELECGGQAHRITWRRGKLVLQHHDVLAERSLQALGATPPLCLEVLDAWRRMREAQWLNDLLLLERTLSPRQLAFRRASHEAVLADAPGVRHRMQRHYGHHPGAAEILNRVERQAAAGLERERRMWAITLIEALPAELRRRLALSVIVTAGRQWHDDRFRRAHAEHVESALSAIVAPLFERSARRWRRNLKPYAAFVAESWVLAPGQQPKCAAWADSGGAFAALELPLSWFTDVWARGIALVEECLVLGLAPGRPCDERELPVLALRWERHDQGTSKSVQAPALVTRADDGWHLRWT